MEGSSWKAALSSGVAPTMSPAPTVSVFWPAASASARSFSSVVARYSAPPAGTPLTAAPLPLGASSAPWKSLNEKNRALATSPLRGLGFAATGLVVAARPATLNVVAASASTIPWRNPRRLAVMSFSPSGRIPRDVGATLPLVPSRVKETWRERLGAVQLACTRSRRIGVSRMVTSTGGLEP